MSVSSEFDVQVPFMRVMVHSLMVGLSDYEHGPHEWVSQAQLEISLSQNGSDSILPELVLAALIKLEEVGDVESDPHGAGFWRLTPEEA